MSNQLVLPRLRPDQWDILSDPARVKVCCMGRRWGKSVLGSVMTLAPAAALGARAAWITPAHSNGRPLWRAACNAVAPLVASKLCRINNSERIISFNNGGFLALYSAESPDSMRGESFHIAVVDESGQISEELINESIAPTLADTDGVLALIGTPKFKGTFFHRIYLQGLSDDTGRIKSWNAPSTANPSTNIQAYVAAAKQRISSRSFRQEYEAVFSDQGGEVFHNIESCVTAPILVQPYPSTFVAGIDFGKSNDYTVVTIMDAENRSVTEVSRFNQIDWSLQRERIAHICKKWNVQSVLAESNSIGQPNIEALRKDHDIPIRGFTTTNATKSEYIEKLILAFEDKTISIPPFNPLIAELESFSFSTLPSGLTRYAAAKGAHDDCVISLALSLKAAETGTVRYHPGLY